MAASLEKITHDLDPAFDLAVQALQGSVEWSLIGWAAEKHM